MTPHHTRSFFSGFFSNKLMQRWVQRWVCHTCLGSNRQEQGGLRTLHQNSTYPDAYGFKASCGTNLVAWPPRIERSEILIVGIKIRWSISRASRSGTPTLRDFATVGTGGSTTSSRCRGPQLLTKSFHRFICWLNNSTVLSVEWIIWPFCQLTKSFDLFVQGTACALESPPYLTERMNWMAPLKSIHPQPRQPLITRNGQIKLTSLRAWVPP